MKITDIRADTLSIGPTIVRVFTDEGVVGLSEIGWHDPAMFLPAPGAGHQAQAHRPGPAASPRCTGSGSTTAPHQQPYPTPAWYVGAIDIALWDIVGKVAGLPLHAILGGAVRHTIPLYWSTGNGGNRTPDEMLAAMRAGWDQGFRAFKIRMDWGPLRIDADPAKDRAMVRAVHAESLPAGTWLGFDANRGYSVSTAIRQGRRAGGAGRRPLRGAAAVARPARRAGGGGGAGHPGLDGRERARPLGVPGPASPWATRTSSSRTSSTRAASPRSAASSMLAAIHGKPRDAPQPRHGHPAGRLDPALRHAAGRRRSRTSCPPSTARRPSSWRTSSGRA